MISDEELINLAAECLLVHTRDMEERLTLRDKGLVRQRRCSI